MHKHKVCASACASVEGSYCKPAFFLMAIRAVVVLVVAKRLAVLQDEKKAQFMVIDSFQVIRYENKSTFEAFAFTAMSLLPGDERV